MRFGSLISCVAPMALVAALVLPAAADSTPPTLYVSGLGPMGGGCSDAGPGSYSDPLCTVQAAANVVVPGQTVVVDTNVSNDYDTEDVHITRSGAPGAPIVFKTGGLPKSGNQPSVVIEGKANGFTLDGVHDVTIEGFGVENTTSTAITVSNSSDITLNNLDVSNDGETVTDGIDVTGDSSDVTISRSEVGANGVTVSLGPGVTGTDVADNLFGFDGSSAAVALNGAANTDITNNTAALTWCPPALFTVAGGATGTSIENNIAFTGCTGSKAMISVSADSTAGTRSDYNVVYAAGDTGDYSWGGTSYATGAQLAAATGQGAHDINARQSLTTGEVPADRSPAIDSADANAPGILPTDLNGNGRVDDPSTANTGTGIGYVDRGALELQDPMTLSVSMNTRQAPTGGTVVATLAAAKSWAPISGYTVDFGDGTPPTSSTSPTITHVYSSVSDVPYQITATVTDSLGNVTTDALPLLFGVVVVPPAPLVPVLTTGSLDEPNALAYYADISGSTDSWSLASSTCDFGDGTGVQQAVVFGCDHTYQAAGTYQVTMTVTDADGNTASATQTLVVGP